MVPVDDVSKPETLEQRPTVPRRVAVELTVENRNFLLVSPHDGDASSPHQVTPTRADVFISTCYRLDVGGKPLAPGSADLPTVLEGTVEGGHIRVLELATDRHP